MATDPINLGTWDVGDLIPIRALFTVKETGAPTDPTTITFYLESKSGVYIKYVYATDSGLIKVSDGLFGVNYSPSLDGDYKGQIEGTGVCQAVTRFTFKVSQSVFH